MVILIADWIDGDVIHLLSFMRYGFFIDLQAYKRTDSFIVNGAYLEYTKKLT